MAERDLLDKRLLFVTGKGGTGKSTVAIALGLLAARRGKRTIVCEVAGRRRTEEALGGGPRVEESGRAATPEVEVAPNLFAASVDPHHALEEYVRIQLGSRRVSSLLTRSRVFQYLAAAAPGVRELVTIGKVWEIAQLERPSGASGRYELVVLDAPATGHGVAMLRSPATFREVARVGRISRQADRIDSFLRSPKRTGVVAVSTAEEMPVRETLDLRDRLDGELGMKLDLVVANGVLPERFSAADSRALGEADGRGSDAARAAVRAALAEHRRARAQRAHLRRLRAEAGRVVTLPFSFKPKLGREELDALSRRLEQQL